MKSAGWGRYLHLRDGGIEMGEKKGHAVDHWQDNLKSLELGKTLGVCAE